MSGCLPHEIAGRMAEGCASTSPTMRQARRVSRHDHSCGIEEGFTGIPNNLTVLCLGNNRGMGHALYPALSPTSWHPDCSLTLTSTSHTTTVAFVRCKKSRIILYLALWQSGGRASSLFSVCSLHTMFLPRVTLPQCSLVFFRTLPDPQPFLLLSGPHIRPLTSPSCERPLCPSPDRCS